MFISQKEYVHGVNVLIYTFISFIFTEKREKEDHNQCNLYL